MSRAAAAPVSRPMLLDHLFLLAGMTLSVYLMLLAPIRAEAGERVSDPRLGQVIAFLPTLMRLPEGILLLWPLFFLTQWPSRIQSLTAGEWLWLLAWVGLLMLAGLTAWEYLLGLPEAMQPHAAKPRLLWYIVVMPAMGVLALLSMVIDLFRSTPPPWTHALGLALVLWPGPAALTVLGTGRFILP